MDGDEYAGTIENILEQETLKWIFVGGKGGVGKTTCSSSLAVQLSKVRKSVLIISTDPAHNLSDAFSQKFSKDPQLVHGFDNLYAMEIESKIELPENDDVLAESADSAAGGFGGLGEMMQDFAGAIPGIDEAMGFAEVMKLVRDLNYSVIVFDTAPTGHTLRFLALPSVLESGISKVMDLKNRFGGMMGQIGAMMGMPGMNYDELFGKLESTRETIQEVNQQFKDPDTTTFVCVAISEFLSLYETERLIQELTKYDIDTHNIVVNQLIMDNADGNKLLAARKRIQDKYLSQIDDLYTDFHVTKLPLLPDEVRGADKIHRFSRFLLNPYRPGLDEL